MLEHLRVVNLGVLENAAVDPSPGFTVITGETGAGKTLLLGGLRLILGGPADSGVVGPIGDEARSEGLFRGSDGEIGASRSVPRNGRSRAHLEGAIVSAATLTERVGAMVEIVGQHDQLSITRPAVLLDLVDSSLESAGEEARHSYVSAWRGLETALEQQGRLGGDRMELERELDLARYQAREIAAADLEPGLDEALESAVSRLRNFEEIKDHLSETLHHAERMSESAGEMVSRLRKAAELDPGLADLSGEAEGLAINVGELARSARERGEELEDEPERLVELEERLTTMGELKRKYGRTLPEVIAYGESASGRVAEMERLLGEADRIDTVVAEARVEVRQRADALGRVREETAVRIAAEMAGHLADLGLPSAVVQLALDPVEPGPKGADRVDLLFASDARLDTGPVGSVASGGELSRLVLALRLATRSGTASTLVFDEVDTGIGGATALAMGSKLASLASRGQVLCVTHLAQVAAHADTHYVVERDDSGVASVRQVTDDDRVTEISRMLAGQPDSTAGKSAAAELLELASS